MGKDGCLLAAMRASDIFSMAGGCNMVGAGLSLPMPGAGGIPPFLFGASRAWGIPQGPLKFTTVRPCPTLNLADP